MNDLIKKLKKDQGMRQSWQATISMCYIDSYRDYSTKTGRKRMRHNDRMIIANNAADLFLNLLCNK